ncbi:MAG: hypothetical protein KatS3mg087_2194 [Patescibacteria group bacterium]|nr:MAG: hypothetical protein KatS3mg087_2194 [Patescibacteria group bacterium]
MKKKNRKYSTEERDFQKFIIRVALGHGWLVQHTVAVPVGWGGYFTPIQGTPGFPDLVLTHPIHKKTLFVELKRDSQKPRESQKIWLNSLAESGSTVCLWQPRLMGEILEYLSSPIEPPGRWVVDGQESTQQEDEK